ncbi:putative pentatricopeptide repeat-containing protein At1g12700, mitochondrial [Punica granatum]|uniref:Pentatricopeptide repeat-containing protein At1g12700, mitochondrial n=1 Tax=Punica granatum TaxID=22663 RepID=A0A6P8EJW5_PUNGR|nr:putative pentatricopeptide repeat-containing protein At1g12700, mitochondrial [Punica granatum]
MGKVEVLLGEMTRKNVMRNGQTCTFPVEAFSKEGKISQAKHLFDALIPTGMEPDRITYNSLMDGDCLQGRVDDASNLFDLMAERDCPADVITYNILINGYGKVKRVDESIPRNARERFDSKCVLTYSTLVGGFCHMGNIQAAVWFLLERHLVGHRPDLQTQSSVSEATPGSKQMKNMLGLVFQNALLTGNNLLLRCQRSIKRRDVQSNDVMQVSQSKIRSDFQFFNHKSHFSGLCHLYLWREANFWFQQMMIEGIEADVVTYTSVVHALCNSGCWEEVEVLLGEMIRRNIMPNVQTCATLVDAFCKDGKISQAECIFAMIIRSGTEPDRITYNSLMDGYCLQGFVDDARNLFDLMAE